MTTCLRYSEKQCILGKNIKPTFKYKQASNKPKLRELLLKKWPVIFERNKGGLRNHAEERRPQRPDD